MKSSAILFLIFITSTALGQGQRTFNQEEVNLKKATSYYEDGKYTEAIPLLEQIVNNGSQ
jgi:predicted S18 family serine protease